MSERLRYRSVTERLDETTTGSFRRPVVSTGRTGSAVVSSRPYGRSGGSQPIQFVTHIATHLRVQSAKSYLFCCVGASDLSARRFYFYSLPEVVVESRQPVKEPELRERSETSDSAGVSQPSGRHRPTRDDTVRNESCKVSGCRPVTRRLPTRRPRDDEDSSTMAGPPTD